MSSADAVRQLETRLSDSTMLRGPGSLVDINTGDLLLTPGVLNKIKTVVKHYGGDIETLYSAIPQTQQSALDEGFFVRRQPPTPQRFSPDQFMAQAYKDLDLPFEQVPPAKTAASAEPISKLSVTLDDGTLEEVSTASDVAMDTVYYRQTLRSGQVLEASGNIVVVGDAHSGSEILADGDILVWGVLGGIAHAGRKGYQKAEIRAIRIEAVQLRIGRSIARRPDRLFKQDNKRRGPEVAKIRDGEIQIFEDIIER
jgi:septum formation inhibitor MinC